MPETYARTSATRVDARRPGRSNVRGTVAASTAVTDTSGDGVSAALAAEPFVAGLHAVSAATRRRADRGRRRYSRRVMVPGSLSRVGVVGAVSVPSVRRRHREEAPAQGRQFRERSAGRVREADVPCPVGGKENDLKGRRGSGGPMPSKHRPIPSSCRRRTPGSARSEKHSAACSALATDGRGCEDPIDIGACDAAARRSTPSRRGHNVGVEPLGRGGKDHFDQGASGDAGCVRDGLNSEPGGRVL